MLSHAFFIQKYVDIYIVVRYNIRIEVRYIALNTVEVVLWMPILERSMYL